MTSIRTSTGISLEGKPHLRMADLLKEAEGKPTEKVDFGNGVVIEKQGGFSKMVGSAQMSLRAKLAAYDAARVGGTAGQAMFETFRKTHPDQFGEAAVARDKALINGELPPPPPAPPASTAPVTRLKDGQTYQATGDAAVNISGGKNVNVTGSAADDFFEVLYGSTVYGLAGNDRIHAGKRSTLDGGEGDDELTAGKDSTLYGGTGNDRLYAGDRSTLDGGEGDDELWGSDDSTLIGGSGNDHISAYDNAVIDGGAGDDLASAYANSTVTDTQGDNYIGVYDGGQVVAGDGNDVIEAYDNSVVNAGGGSNWVRAGDHSSVTTGGGDDYVHIGAGGDLSSGAGNDTVIVGANTTIHFNRGDGNDQIGGGEYGRAYVATENLSSSILSFGTGIVPADLTMTRQGNDLLVKVGADSITLKDVQRHGIPTMSFADGSVLYGREVDAMVGPADAYQPASQVMQRFWDASTAYSNQLNTTGTAV